MILVGLTGGIGSGKSTVAGFLKDAGVWLVDADQLARRVVEPGQPGLEQLVQAFGPGILTPEGHLDRPQMARLAFSNPEHLQRLNQITHRQIQILKRQELALIAAQDPKALVVYDVPLLFELAMQSQFQATLLVTLRPEQQLSRLVEQRGMDPADAKARIQAQMPLADKEPLADFIIHNEGDLKSTQAQVQALLPRLLALPQADPLRWIQP